MSADATEKERREADVQAYGAVTYARTLDRAKNVTRAEIARQEAIRSARGEGTPEQLQAFVSFVASTLR